MPEETAVAVETPAPEPFSVVDAPEQTKKRGLLRRILAELPKLEENKAYVLAGVGKGNLNFLRRRLEGKADVTMHKGVIHVTRI